MAIIPNSLNEYQAAAVQMLVTMFAPTEACAEWRSEFGARIYSPRLDIAVGPFATGSLRLGLKYAEMARERRSFLERLHARHRDNVSAHGEQDSVLKFDDLLERNPNARCFLGVEIENKVTRKHLMGGALNASALSKVAVLIGWTSEKVRALV